MSKKIFSEKKICSNINPGHTNSGQNSFWSKQISVKKIFWLKRKFDPKCFKFLSKKLGRVNPGAGIHDPPPENSKVKIV